MTTIVEATFDGEVFRPKQPVALEPNTNVRLTVEPATIAKVFKVLAERYDSGETDVAERHNEHQP